MNSIPKSGTHLLMQLLDSCPGLHFSGRFYSSGAISSEEEATAAVHALRGELGRVRQSQYICGHIAYDPDVRRVVDESGVVRLLMVRDPRDLATSHAAYLSKNQQHSLHRRFIEDFDTLEERTRAVIEGVPASKADRGLPPLAERLGRYVSWLGDADTFLVRFEELVGPAGGGSLPAQQALIGRMVVHLGLGLSEETISSVGERVFSPASATFRRGQVGGWKTELSDDNRSRVEDTCGDFISRLGFE